MSAEPIVGLDGVGTIPEEVGEVIESPDYSPRRIAIPGKYLSTQREIVATEKTSNEGRHYISFAIRLVGGITDAEGRIYGDGQWPFRDWINTLPLKRKDFATGQDFPGTTSSAAEYLKATGTPAKGLTLEQAKEAILLTQATPVYVRIGRSERSVKHADGTYSKRKTYTKHWNKGTKESPIWATELEWEGETLLARETIEGYQRVA